MENCELFDESYDSEESDACWDSFSNNTPRSTWHQTALVRLDQVQLYKSADNRTQEELLRTTQLVYNFEAGKMVPKLREPRNLYALSKEPGPQQAARWPAELQVENDRIHHIRYVPTEPEPLYKITGLEKTPMVRGQEYGGKVIFHYEPKTSFFVRSRVGGSRSGCDNVSYIPTSPDDTTLIFESRFESGNLAKVLKVGENDYELYLRYDLFTSKHTQWYYFRVKNTRPNINYRFTIVNFMKSDSLYNYGMKPLMYSEKTAQQKRIGWIRSGTNIKYYRNNMKYEMPKGDKSFYSLTWMSQFQHANDEVYFSHCYPYTYTDLQDYLLELSNDPVKSRICKQRVLCRTIAGNLVYLLTITSPCQQPEDLKHKKAVVITSRVHPGESNSSLMMKGFLDYLTGNTADAKLLRDTFIFKIVPMLNPDGVIVGNYRCSLAGRDLNRNYKTMLKDSYPSVWHTRSMIRKLIQEREVAVYCDLHGHSRKQNVFIYGCENKHNKEKRLQERIFPCMLSKNAPNTFSFNLCKFKVQKSKEGTGRIVVWNMGIMNSFTLEATFCGSSLGKKKGYHFSVADFESLGYHFCDTLLDYCDPDNTKCANIYLDLEERLKQEILSKMEVQGITSPERIDFSDFSSDFESSDGGSDSSVSDGPPVHLQYATQRTSKKKKKLKSRKERDHQADQEGKDKKVALSSQSSVTPPAAAVFTVSESPSPVKKPLSGHQTSHAKQDQPIQNLKYSMTHKRPRSTEDRTRLTDKTEDKPKRNDYLEALTVAYLKNGIPLLNDPVLRYTGSDGSVPNLPFNLDGLCPHHEQTFAAQYVAHQLHAYGGAYSEGNGQLKGSKLPTRSIVIKKTEAEARPVFANLKLPSGIRDDQHEDSKSRKPFPRHLFDISSSQQRQIDKSKLLKQHPNPFDEKKDKQLYPRSQVPSATNISYDAVAIGDGESLENLDKHRREVSRSRCNSRNSYYNGRKSRLGMHSDEEDTKPTTYSAHSCHTKKTTPPTTVSSASRTTPTLSISRRNSSKQLLNVDSNEDMIDSSRSIDDLRQSVTTKTAHRQTSFASVPRQSSFASVPRQSSFASVPRQSSFASVTEQANATAIQPTSVRKSIIEKMIQETNDEIEELKQEIKDELAEKALANERREISVLQDKMAKSRSFQEKYYLNNDNKDSFGVRSSNNSFVNKHPDSACNVITPEMNSVMKSQQMGSKLRQASASSTSSVEQKPYSQIHTTMPDTREKPIQRESR